MIPPHSSVSLPEVRRLEAVSFRSWPAAVTRFDGTWAIRLTADHPAKRLNSINPLDPADHLEFEERVVRAADLFGKCERPLIFRQSPLAPMELENRLDARGWRRFDESLVMTLDLTALPRDNEPDHIPFDVPSHWLDQCIAMGTMDQLEKSGLLKLLTRVEGQVSLFLSEREDGSPLAAVMAVQFDELVGLFEVVSSPSARNAGHARKLVRAALSWSRLNGASLAWLQVVASNEAAIGLYHSLAFAPAYSCAYRQAPEAFHG